MTITLYVTGSRHNAINKKFGSSSERSGKFREEVNIMSPSLVIDAPANIVSNYNYLYIPSFKRYYYIDSITSIANNLTEVSCSIDVLMTYKDKGLMSCKGIVERCTSDGDGYLQDAQVVKRAYNDITTQMFPNKIIAENYVLAIAGFGATE